MAQAISASTKRLSINSSVLTKWARRTVFYILLLALWQVLASSAIWPDYLFPGPLAVFNSLVDGFQNGLLLDGERMPRHELRAARGRRRLHPPGFHQRAQRRSIGGPYCGVICE